jgi:hypothetical protein
MPRFERTHLVLKFIQTFALVAALVVALCIGRTQNKINRDLLELNYLPSVEVTYVNREVHIANKGKENIWVLGGRIDGVADDLATNGVLISPGGFYFIPGDKLENYLRRRVGGDGSTKATWEFDLRAGNGVKYTVTTLFIGTITKDVPDIRTQTVSIVRTAKP